MYWKDIDHKGSIYNNAPMPYSVFFNGGTAFHEGSLSVPSAGRIHLSHDAAVKFYNSLHEGDTVQVVDQAAARVIRPVHCPGGLIDPPGSPPGRGSSAR